MLRHAERLGQVLASLLAGAGLMVLIGFAAATLLDGVSRSLLNAPIEALDDAGPYIVAAAVSACFPLAMLRRSNITIEIAGMVFGPRTGQCLRAFAALLVAITMAAMAWQMTRYAGDARSGGDTTVMLGIATAPFWYIVGAMFAVSSVVQILVAVSEISRAIAGQMAPIAQSLHP